VEINEQEKTVVSIYEMGKHGVVEAEDPEVYAQCMKSLAAHAGDMFSISQEGRIEVDGPWPTMIDDMFILSYWYDTLLFSVYEPGYEPLPRMLYFVDNKIQVAATIVVFEDFNADSLMTQEDYNEEEFGDE
jgi:hypothetical protein